MSNPKYKNIGLPEDKVIEECSGLIHIICKAKRFGYLNWHPKDKLYTPNFQRIYDEMNDLLTAMREYEKWMLKYGCLNKKKLG